MKKSSLISACILLLLFLLGVAAFSQTTYNLGLVPDTLKNRANVIMHSENIAIDIESTRKVTVNDHKIFTVLNSDGKDWLDFDDYSNSFMSLDKVDIRVYDVHGNQIAKYQKIDLPTIDAGEGLIPDGYVTHFKIPGLVFPVTVDLQYQKKIKSSLMIPDYRFIEPQEGVLESNCTVKVIPEIGFRYQARNTSIQPVVVDYGKYKIYTWTVKNLPPVESEPGSVAVNERYPQIIFATDKFSFLGSDGDLSSWRNLGIWMQGLYKGLDELPANRQQFFIHLVSHAADDKEKIRRIYEYLQHNFRYVNIQLGIGGFQPSSARFTDQKKYGDCKDLSNYMKAALKTVGINSCVAIVNAEYNQEPVDPNFPANEFNHVILCVPHDKDSIWLECTSSTIEFGRLGTFTENRNALLITDDGGVLVPTPKSVPEENILSTVSTVTISDNLSGSIKTIFTTKGEFKEVVDDILNDNKEDQEQAIVNYFGFKQPDDFTFTKNNGAEDKASLGMEVGNVSDFNDSNKLFFASRMGKIWSRTLPKAENRKSDFYFHFPFEKKDTTIFKLPTRIKPDVLPKDTTLECTYAVYRTTHWYNEKENSIYCVTWLTLKQHKIPVSDYASVKKFFDDIATDDAQKLVLQQ